MRTMFAWSFIGNSGYLLSVDIVDLNKVDK